MNIFEEVKNRLDIVQVVCKYGFKPNRNGFIRCPFHAEHTASLKLYTDTNSYYCFGCGEHGDSIKFVQLLYNLSPIESAKKLNSDFGLGIQTERQTTTPPKPQERQPTQSEIYRYFENWINTAWRKLNNYYKFLLRWNEIYKPTAEQPLPWEYVIVLEDLTIIKSLCELFTTASHETIYLNFRKDIDFYYGRYEYFRKFDE